MKIIGISYGRELPNQVYLMADSAIIRSNKPFFVPNFAQSFSGIAAIVLHIDRLGKHIAPRFAHRYCHSVSPAIKVNASGLSLAQPSESTSALSSSFDGGLLLGDDMPITDIKTINNAKVTIARNDESHTALTLNEMGIDISNVISQLSVYFTLKMGDMIVVELQGCQATELTPGDTLRASLNDAAQLVIRVK